MSPILLPFNYEQSHDPRVPKSKFLLQHSLNPPSSNVFQTLEARRGEFGRVDFEREAAEKKKKEKELWATSGADEDTAPVIGRGVLTRGGGRAARVASCPHEEEHSGSQSQRETRASKPSTPKNSSLSLGRPRKTFLPPSPPLFCSTKWRLRVAIERRSDVSASDFTTSDA